MRLSVAPVLLIAALAAGQSPFLGMWQTKTNRVGDKPGTTVVVVELEKRLGGAVVLVNSDGSEVKLPILNLKIAENVMEFETRSTGLCFWSLRLQSKGDRGLLHRGCPGVMMLDEPVQKRAQIRE